MHYTQCFSYSLPLKEFLFTLSNTFIAGISMLSHDHISYFRLLILTTITLAIWWRLTSHMLSLDDCTYHNLIYFIVRSPEQKNLVFASFNFFLVSWYVKHQKFGNMEIQYFFFSRSHYLVNDINHTMESYFVSLEYTNICNQRSKSPT